MDYKNSLVFDGDSRLDGKIWSKIVILVLISLWVDLSEIFAEVPDRLPQNSVIGKFKGRVVMVFDFDDVLHPTRSISKFGGGLDLFDLNVDSQRSRLSSYLYNLRDTYQAKIFIVSRGNIYRNLIGGLEGFEDIGVQGIKSAFGNHSISTIGIEALSAANKGINLDHSLLKVHAFKEISDALTGFDHPNGRILFFGDIVGSDNLEIVSDKVVDRNGVKYVKGTNFRYQFFHIRDTFIKMPRFTTIKKAKSMIESLLQRWGRRLGDVKEQGIASFIGSRESAVSLPVTEFSFGCRNL